MSAAPDGIVPDTKDWTWVLDRPCPDCGFDPAAGSLAELPRAYHDTAMTSTDVHELVARRVGLMLAEDEPTFANWDQDATVVGRDYHLHDVGAV